MIISICKMFVENAKQIGSPAYNKTSATAGAAMNYLWAAMVLIGIVYGLLTGRSAEVTEAALSSAREAVTLCITMTGVMSFWVGIMKIAEKSGMIRSLAGKMDRLLLFLFPRLKYETKAKEYIATNMIANIFGLGWAATPAGLKAMEELDKCSPQPPGNKTATREMCTFLIINISSLQLIPVNMIAYRSQYGSVKPTEIVGPAIIATCVSTVVAVIFCKIMDTVDRKKSL